MDEEILKRLARIESQIDSIYHTIQLAKKMLIWSVILSLLLFVIPLIILAFVLPTLMETMTSIYSGF